MTVYPTNCPDLDALLQAVVDGLVDLQTRCNALSIAYDRRSNAVGKLWGINRALREALTSAEAECYQEGA
jgi:hypothetical protein